MNYRDLVEKLSSIEMGEAGPAPAPTRPAPTRPAPTTPRPNTTTTSPAKPANTAQNPTSTQHPLNPLNPASPTYVGNTPQGQPSTEPTTQPSGSIPGQQPDIGHTSKTDPQGAITARGTTPSSVQPQQNSNDLKAQITAMQAALAAVKTQQPQKTPPTSQMQPTTSQSVSQQQAQAQKDADLANQPKPGEPIPGQPLVKEGLLSSVVIELLEQAALTGDAARKRDENTRIFYQALNSPKEEIRKKAQERFDAQDADFKKYYGHFKDWAELVKTNPGLMDSDRFNGTNITQDMRNNLYDVLSQEKPHFKNYAEEMKKLWALRSDKNSTAEQRGQQATKMALALQAGVKEEERIKKQSAAPAQAAPAKTQHPGNPTEWANGKNPPPDWVKDPSTGKYAPPPGGSKYEPASSDASSSSPPAAAPASSDGETKPESGKNEKSGGYKNGTIGVGVKSKTVGDLQDLLNASGFTDDEGKKLKIDNDFGPRTKQAVMKLQKALNDNGAKIEVDGKWGPNSKAAAAKLGIPNVTTDTSAPAEAPALGKVPPQPTINGKPSMNGPKGKAWLAKYGETHNPDGTPKATGSGMDPEAMARQAVAMRKGAKFTDADKSAAKSLGLDLENDPDLFVEKDGIYSKQHGILQRYASGDNPAQTYNRHLSRKIQNISGTPDVAPDGSAVIKNDAGKITHKWDNNEGKYIPMDASSSTPVSRSLSSEKPAETEAQRLERERAEAQEKSDKEMEAQIQAFLNAHPGVTYNKTNGQFKDEKGQHLGSWNVYTNPETNKPYGIDISGRKDFKTSVPGVYTGKTAVEPSAPSAAEPPRSQSVSGTVKLGKADGPITFNGKTLNPGDDGYAEAEKELLKSQANIDKARSRGASPSANGSAVTPVSQSGGAVNQSAGQQLPAGTANASKPWSFSDLFGSVLDKRINPNTGKEETVLNFTGRPLSGTVPQRNAATPNQGTLANDAADIRNANANDVRENMDFKIDLSSVTRELLSEGGATATTSGDDKSAWQATKDVVGKGVDAVASAIPQPVKDVATKVANNPVVQRTAKYVGPAGAVYGGWNSVIDFDEADEAEAKGDKVGAFLKRGKGTTSLAMVPTSIAAMTPAAPIAIPADIALAIANGTLTLADWARDKYFPYQEKGKEKIAKEDLDRIMSLTKYKAGN